MARLPRQDWPGALHHLYGRGNGKQTLFRDEEDFSFFLRRLGELSGELGVKVLAYCLMTTHYHLVLESGASPLPEMMHRLLTAYARVFNDRWNRVGHPFQGRYQNRIVSSDNDLRNVVRYVHLNPVEAGMVSDPAEWRWSSHRSWLGEHDALTDRERVFALFADVADYKRFLLEPRGGDDRTSLDELGERFGGEVLLRSRGRSQTEKEQRRCFIAAAVEAGYRRSQIARYMGRTTAALCMLLRAQT